MRSTHVRLTIAATAALVLLLSACDGTTADTTTTISSTTASSSTVTTVQAATTTDATTTLPPTTTSSDSTTSATPSSTSPASTSTTEASGSLVIDVFAPSTVDDAGYESIGCWMRLTESADPFEPVFFTGYDGGIIVVDGETIALEDDDLESPPVVLKNAEVGASYSGGGYTVMFTEVGEPVSTSIESTDQDVTIEVTGPDDAVGEVVGILGCGV